MKEIEQSGGLATYYDIETEKGGQDVRRDAEILHENRNKDLRFDNSCLLHALAATFFLPAKSIRV